MFVAERPWKSEQSEKKSECNLMRDLRYPCRGREYIWSRISYPFTWEHWLASMVTFARDCSVGQWEVRPRKPVSVLVQWSATWNRNSQGKFVRCTLLSVVVINQTVIPFAASWWTKTSKVRCQSLMSSLENLCPDEECFLITFSYISFFHACVAIFLSIFLR